MALTSRRQREQEQRKRKARGRRNLSQLAGPVSGGERRPIQQGYKSQVTGLQAPKFQESNVGNDITTAGLAYKGAKGIRDWAGKSPGLQKTGGLLSDFGKNLMGGSPSNAVSLLGSSGVMEALPGTYGAAGGIGNIPTGAFDPTFIGPTQPYNALSTSAADASSAAGGGSDLMGNAGAALGAGLNIYDMTQQGVTAGNALGLGGSALLGFSNAWNPLGLAMLGTSAAGSLFDWW